MLKIENVDVFYGGSQVLFDVNLVVQAGEGVSVLGRNGAGKTTLIKSIVGLVKPRQGGIHLNGREINTLPPEKIARMGVAYVPDAKRLFPMLTARENLLVSAIGCGNPKIIFDPTLEYFPQLKPLLHRKAGSLSGGEQQMLAIARAFIRRPSLALLDEPSQGLAPLVVENLKKIILKRMQEDKTAFLVVEQEIDFATGVANRLYGLLTGAIVYEGTPQDFYATKAYERFMAVG